MLVNARHVKNMPGRKSDVSDAAWLADLGAHGLVRGSFVPPEPIRQLRDLTRTRTAITHERGREVQRLEDVQARPAARQRRPCGRASGRGGRTGRYSRSGMAEVHHWHQVDSQVRGMCWVVRAAV